MLTKGLKNFFKLNKRNFTTNKIISRCFSVKSDKFRESLNEEIKYEKENYEPINEKEMKDFKASSNFEIVDLKEKMKTELRKTVRNYEVIVSFNARPPIENEDEHKNQEEESKNIFLNE